MPFDSQGNFTRVMNWQEDAANAVPIVASRHDDEDNNFAQGFNDCFCRDGRATAQGNFKMGSYKITGLSNGTTTNDAVNYGQLSTAQTTLQGNIDTKANDDAVVKLSGNQTINGVKTFASSPIIPTPASSDNSTKGATTEWVKNQEYLGYPDYAHATVLSKANGTVSSNGWLHFQGANNTYGYTITINGFAFELSDAYGTADELLVPVKAGDTYTCSSWSYISSLKYIPNR